MMPIRKKKDLENKKACELLQLEGSSFLTRDQTQASCIGSTGQPGKTEKEGYSNFHSAFLF